MRMMMMTTVTTRKGEVVTKLGIGPCSFIGYEGSSRTQGEASEFVGLATGLSATTRLPPATATTFTTRPAGISESAVAVMLCDAPAKLMRTVPKWLAGIPTDTRPVDPTISSRLKESVDSACFNTLKAPNATLAQSKPATVATPVATPTPALRLCRPKSPPAPTIAMNPSSRGAGDTPATSKPRWIAPRMPPKMSSTTRVKRSRPPPSRRQKANTRSAALMPYHPSLILGPSTSGRWRLPEAVHERPDQRVRARVDAPGRQHLVHDVGEREAQPRVREGDRAAHAVVAEGALAGHRSERKWELEAGAVVGLVAHHQVLASRLGPGGLFEGSRIEQSHAIDLADARGLQARERACGADAVRGRDLRPAESRVVEGARKHHRVDERAVEQGGRIEEPRGEYVRRASWRRGADHRCDSSLHFVRQADPELKPKRLYQPLRHEPSHALTGDAPDDLAGEPSERADVIPVRRARLPQRALGCPGVDDRIPGVDVLEGHRTVDRGEPCAMAEQPADRDAFLAFSGKFRPVVDHRQVEVELSLLRQHVCGDGEQALGG